MADTMLLHHLRDKYARKLGEIRARERELASLRHDLRKMQAAIALFDPAWSGDAVRPVRPARPSRWGKAGRGMRAALDVLREATEPMTAHELAVAALERLDMPIPSNADLRLIMASFNGALARKVGKGIVCHPGRPKRWAVER